MNIYLEVFINFFILPFLLIISILGIFQLRQFVNNNPDKLLSQYIEDIKTGFNKKSLYKGILGMLILCFLNRKFFIELWNLTVGTDEQIIILFAFVITFLSLIVFFTLSVIVFNSILFLIKLIRKRKSQ